MKSLKIIQVLCKIGQILSKIAFILCIVGASLSLLGILSLACGIETIEINGVTIGSMIQNDSGMSMETMYTTLAVGIVMMAGEIAIAKFAELYFKHELIAGTPLTLEGAKEMRRLGILKIAISLGTVILAAIVQAILKATLTDVVEVDLDHSGAIVMGVMYLILSLVLQYASEELKNKEEKIEISSHQENEKE